MATTDEKPAVVSEAARNPAIGGAAIEALASTEDEDVLRGLARNPNAPAEVLLQLAKCRHNRVKKPLPVTYSSLQRLRRYLSKAFSLRRSCSRGAASTSSCRTRDYQQRCLNGSPVTRMLTCVGWSQDT